MDSILKECLQGVLDQATQTQKLLEDLEILFDSDFSETDQAMYALADIISKVDNIELLLRELVDNG